MKLGCNVQTEGRCSHGARNSSWVQAGTVVATGCLGRGVAAGTEELGRIRPSAPKASENRVTALIVSQHVTPDRDCLIKQVSHTWSLAGS